MGAKLPERYLKKVSSVALVLSGDIRMSMAISFVFLHTRHQDDGAEIPESRPHIGSEQTDVDTKDAGKQVEFATIRT